MPGLSATVTVVIPVYNAEATLARALESVYRQSLPAGEILCVDDGSRDASEEVVRAFQTRPGPALRWLHDGIHRGAGGARNLGVDEARGQLIAFLDADDAWHPQKLFCQVKALRLQGLDLVGGHSAICKDARWSPEGVEPDLRLHSVSLRRAMLSNPFHTSSVLMRRATTLRFPETGKLAEDYALWLGLVAAGWRCGQHPTPLSAMFKQPYGQAGLSARLMRMQMGELAVLAQVGARADPAWLAVALPWSCAKGLRRMVFASSALRWLGVPRRW